jgi:cation transport ATPase
VQSALKAVKGVKEAAVSLETHEAVVKYDPKQVKVEDLIRAVKNARGMHAYDAKVKNECAQRDLVLLLYILLWYRGTSRYQFN